MTPIDPTDTYKLAAIHEEAADFMCDDCWFDAPGGAGAVARAVCPEHHAVYDTREFDLVPKKPRNHAEKVVK